MHLSGTSINNDQEPPTTGYRELVVVDYQAPSVAAGLHKFSPA
jgi:hypothetical protein